MRASDMIHRALVAALLLPGLPLPGVTQPDRAHDPLLLLPVLGKPAWAATPAPPQGEAIPGIPTLRMVKGERVVMDAVLNMDSGPQDGMEVVACMRDGKTHEALLRVELSGNQGRYVKFACIGALGTVNDGVPSGEGSGLPARGTPMRLRVYWHDDDGTWKVIDASCLIRDRDMDRAYPPLPFVYTGSRIVAVQESGPDGKPVRRERFMLDSTRSIAVAYDEADALFASPFPGAMEDARFEANSALCPPTGTKLIFSIEKAELPLELSEDDHGALSYQGHVVDDSHLQSLLAASFSSAAPADRLRAVAIQTSRSIDREIDIGVRAHVLAVAAQAKTWVVPVFVLPAG